MTPTTPAADRSRWAQLRLSDAERDRAAQALGEHFAHGRLTADEHEERTERAYAARTHAELPPLFADLPGGSPVPAQTQPRPAYPGTSLPRRGRRRAGFGPLLMVLVAVAVVAVVLSHLPLVLVVLALAWLLTRPLRRGRPRSWARC
ncbi:MAG: DUF1707 domain-containing protein [Nocardioides sp.]